MSQPLAQQSVPQRGNRFAAREEILAEITLRLAQGEPLAKICRDAWMPSVRTVWEWQRADADLDNTIARAREAGADMIAQRARETARGFGDSTGDVQRDKLIVDTDLKLLAKWDPKRYGDNQQLRLADADGGKLDTAPLVAQLLDAVRAGRPAGGEGD